MSKAVLVVLASALAGCVAPVPPVDPPGPGGPSTGTTASDEAPGWAWGNSSVALADPSWFVVPRPFLVSGRPGEVVPFDIVVAAHASAPPARLVPPPWVRLDNGSAPLPLPPGGGVVRGEVLVGAVPTVRLLLQVNRSDVPNEAPYVWLKDEAVPPAMVEVLGVDADRTARVEVANLTDAVDAEEGLQASLRGDRLRVVYSLGTITSGCLVRVDAVGHHVVATGDPLEFLGFVAVDQNDVCVSGHPPFTPRVEWTVPWEGGAARVRVFEHRSGVPTYYPVQRAGGWEEDVLEVKVASGQPS